MAFEYMKIHLESEMKKTAIKNVKEKLKVIKGELMKYRKEIEYTKLTEKQRIKTRCTKGKQIQIKCNKTLKKGRKTTKKMKITQKKKAKMVREKNGQWK